MIPPLTYSGFNLNKFDPSLIYVYDPTIGSQGAYRAVQPSDLASNISLSGVTISGSNNTPITYTDRGGTITGVNVSQQIMASNSSRKTLIIQNISTGNLWFNFGAAATSGNPSLKLLPDQTYESSPGFPPTQSVALLGFYSGQAFSSKEGN